MTVGEVIKCLTDYPPDLPVTALYACETADGNIKSVSWRSKEPDTVFLVVE